MRKVNAEKNPSRQLPQIPDRYELTEYIQGRLSRNRRREIREILASGNPAAQGARLDLEEIKSRIKAMFFRPLTSHSSREMQNRMAAVLNHSGDPTPGEIWSLRTQESPSDFSHERSMLILYVRGNFARVAPVTKEIEFAGPRDIIVRDHAFASVPFMLELFTSFWIDFALLVEKAQFEARISDKILSSVRKADRGVYTNLPRGVRRGSVQEISDIGEFHEEWREGERMLFETLKTSPFVLEEFEAADVEKVAEPQPIPIPVSFISYQQPTQYVYRLAAADQTFTVSEFQFWEKERGLSGQMRRLILQTPTYEVRVSIIDGHLFLVAERADKSPKIVSDVSLSSGETRILTTENSVQFSTSQRVHLHFDVDPALPLTGRWILRFSLDDKEYLNEVEFK